MNIDARGSLATSVGSKIVEQRMEEPALEPPFGVEPDFANPGGDHVLGYSIIAICSILSSAVVVLRLCSRYLLKRFKIQDALFIASLGLYAGHQYAVYQLSIYPGLHVHQWNVRMKTHIQVQHNFHIAFVLYGLVIMCLKACILLDWVEIFVPAKQRNLMFWASHAIIWCNVIFYSVGTIVGILQCIPHEKIWNPLIAGSCPMNMTTHNRTSGAVNLVSDLLILAVPQRVIWKLNMSRKKKVGLSFLFAIGALACVLLIVRIVHTLSFLDSDDKLYSIGDLGLWTNGEMTCGFLIMGIPSLPKVVENIAIPELISSLFRLVIHRVSHSITVNNADENDGSPWKKLDDEEEWKIQTVDSNAIT